MGLPLAVRAVLRVPGVEAVERLHPLGPLAVAILLFGVSSLLHANQFIAAFVAGSVVATLSPQASRSFRHTGELLSELTKGPAGWHSSTRPATGSSVRPPPDATA